jgi:hypothetical protein
VPQPGERAIFVIVRTFGGEPMPFGTGFKIHTFSLLVQISTSFIFISIPVLSKSRDSVLCTLVDGTRQVLATGNLFMKDNDSGHDSFSQACLSDIWPPSVKTYSALGCISQKQMLRQGCMGN